MGIKVISFVDGRHELHTHQTPDGDLPLQSNQPRGGNRTLQISASDFGAYILGGSCVALDKEQNICPVRLSVRLSSRPLVKTDIKKVIGLQ